MFMFYILFGLISLVLGSEEELYASIKQQTERLHAITNFSTYYDFFNVGENAKEVDIKKAFRRLGRKKSINITNLEYDELLKNGYNLLTLQRAAYNKFLGDSKILFLTEEKNYKNYRLGTVLAIICMILCIDFITFSFKYLKYSERIRVIKKDKKAKKSLNKPSLFLVNIFYRLKSKLFN